MYYYKIDIPIKKPYPEYISLIPIADIHNGNPYSNLPKALEFRDYILATPYVYTIDGGDDMDNVTKESKGNIYEQQYSPFHQRQKTIEFWKPVQEAKKLLCILDDNHSNRSKNSVDWRIVEDVCSTIGAKYGGFGCFLELKIGEQRYTIYAIHGKKGGTSPASALNNLISMNQRCISDIYLRFHHHKKIVYQDEVKRLTAEGLKEHKRTYGISGSFINWDNSYAEQLEYPISVQGCIKLKLFVNKWDVHISL